MISSPHYDYGLLRRAIGFSLLAHALILLQPGFSKVSSQTTTAQSLFALLKPRAEAVLANTPAAPKVPVRHASPQVRETSDPDALTAPATPVQPAALGNVGPQSTAVTGTSNTTPGTATVASNVEYDFAESKKSYLFAIAAEARRVKKYPPRAFAAGLTGTAEIHIAVAAGGNVQPPHLQKSSGSAEIDNAALAFVGLALKRTPVPESLRSQAFEFMLPVSFRINDE